MDGGGSSPRWRRDGEARRAPRALTLRARVGSDRTMIPDAHSPAQRTWPHGAGKCSRDGRAYVDATAVGEQAYVAVDAPGASGLPNVSGRLSDRRSEETRSRRRTATERSRATGVTHPSDAAAARAPNGRAELRKRSTTRRAPRASGRGTACRLRPASVPKCALRPRSGQEPVATCHDARDNNLQHGLDRGRVGCGSSSIPNTALGSLASAIR